MDSSPVASSRPGDRLSSREPRTRSAASPAPTLSAHLLRDPQERRYFEVDHFSISVFKKPAHLVRVRPSSQIDFHDFSKRREAIEKRPVVIGPLTPFPKTDTIKSAQLARDHPIAITETRIVSK
jgi:hypothetical protein